MIMRSIARIAAAGTMSLALAGAALAAEGPELPSVDWPHEGIFGQYDRGAVRRGYQVYQEVCSSCHAMKYIAFRNLTDVGFTSADVTSIAAEAFVIDGPNMAGEMFERPGRPSDYLPSPFANEQAARYANNGALPPDLSVMTKARKGGADYLYALLTGYEDPPAEMEPVEGQSYNRFFANNWTAMPQPLFDDVVEYADGTEASLDQVAQDVVTFLAWAAEPEMEARKNMGIKVILFLLVLTALIYAVKRRLWAGVH